MTDLHELGSGFDVTNRDSEIRGPGSLLGTEQSGMAARVGFDLHADAEEEHASTSWFGSTRCATKLCAAPERRGQHRVG